MPAPARPLRVALDAHVVGRRKTGNETYLIGLAAGLAARTDVALTIYLERRATWPVGDGAPRLRRLLAPWPHLRIPLELPIRSRLDGVDLLHVQYVAPPVSGVPVVTAVHDVSFEDEPQLLPALMRWRLQATVRASVRVSSVVVTPSEFSRGRMLQVYQLDPERVVVTPPAIPAERPFTPLSEDDFRTKLGLPGDFVLAVGNQEPRKNIPRLIDAVARLRGGGLEVGLVLAGQHGSGTRDVEGAIERHAADGWVRRLGYVDGALLDALYARARTLAYVSLYEGFGLPLLEAMHRGTPVVAASRAAVPEVAGDAALLVDPFDVEAMADALAAAATDPGVRARLAAAGPIRAGAFTTARLAEATMQAYREALSRQRPVR